MTRIRGLPARLPGYGDGQVNEDADYFERSSLELQLRIDLELPLRIDLEQAFQEDKPPLRERVALGSGGSLSLSMHQ